MLIGCSVVELVCNGWCGEVARPTLSAARVQLSYRRDLDARNYERTYGSLSLFSVIGPKEMVDEFKSGTARRLLLRRTAAGYSYTPSWFVLSNCQLIALSSPRVGKTTFSVEHAWLTFSDITYGCD